MAGKRLINVRVSTEEDALLSDFAQATGRTRTDVLRELIRGLNRKLRTIERRAATPERGGAAKTIRTTKTRKGKAS